MKSAVLVFPASNCDRDMIVALENITGQRPHLIWHQDTEIPDVDFIAIPGGFSYGDYLRCGAMAARSNAMAEVISYAKNGGKLFGVCNGFQILTETNLLPGALMRNKNLKFICKDVILKIENKNSLYTTAYRDQDLITVPVAHHDGNYFADQGTLNALEDNQQVAFRYVDEHGDATSDANPNGSQNNIAGILNKEGNILGMMPHPERYINQSLGGNDGRALFTSILNNLL